MARKLVVAGVVGCVFALLAGCLWSRPPRDPYATFAANVSIIDGTMQDLYEMFDAIGATDARASSRTDGCHGSGRGVQYSAGMDGYVGDDLVGNFNALRRQLENRGWKMTDDMRGDNPDPAKPAWRFEREDLWVDVDTGEYTSRGKTFGAGRIRVDVELFRTGCVQLANGMGSFDFEDFEKKIFPRRHATD